MTADSEGTLYPVDLRYRAEPAWWPARLLPDGPVPSWRTLNYDDDLRDRVRKLRHASRVVRVADQGLDADAALLWMRREGSWGMMGREGSIAYGTAPCVMRGCITLVWSS